MEMRNHGEFKVRIWTCLATSGVVVAVFCLSAHSVCAQSTIKNGAHRLCDLQADITSDNAHNGLIDDDPDDGGWDWTINASNQHHSASPSPTNIYGVTALGLLYTLKSTGGPIGSNWSHDFIGIDNNGIFPEISGSGNTGRFLQACIDVHLGMVADPSIDSAPDYVFLVLFEQFGPAPSQTYADLAKARYDAKVATYGSAQLLGEFLRDFRGGLNQDGLIPYELDWHTQAALALDSAFPGQGYDLDATAYVQVMVDDINNASGYFDINNNKEYAYTIGLACGAAALSRTGLYPTLMDDMLTNLLTMQKTNGSFKYSSMYPTGNFQSTAYAVIALFLDGSPGYMTAAQDASDWFAFKQAANGGWAKSGEETPTVDGEILTALYYVPSTPSRGSKGAGLPGDTQPDHYPPAFPSD